MARIRPGRTIVETDAGSRRAKEGRDIASLVRRAKTEAEARVGSVIDGYEIILLVAIMAATGAERAAGEWAMGDPVYTVRSAAGEEQLRYSQIRRAHQSAGQRK